MNMRTPSLSARRRAPSQHRTPGPRQERNTPRSWRGVLYLTNQKIIAWIRLEVNQIWPTGQGGCHEEDADRIYPGTVPRRGGPGASDRGAGARRTASGVWSEREHGPNRPPVRSGIGNRRGAIFRDDNYAPRREQSIRAVPDGRDQAS